MLWEVDLGGVGEDDSVGAPLEGCFKLLRWVLAQACYLVFRVCRVGGDRHTKGMISAGSVTSLWAISSLNLIRSLMFTSQ